MNAERRPAETEAALGDLAGGLIEFKNTARIGASVKTDLDSDSTKIRTVQPRTETTSPDIFVTVAGTEINLTAIGAGSDNPRYETFLAGWTIGHESREAEIQRLRWERDLFYFCYANKKRPGDFYTHLTNELWREGSR